MPFVIKHSIPEKTTSDRCFAMDISAYQDYGFQLPIRKFQGRLIRTTPQTVDCRESKGLGIRYSAPKCSRFRP